MTFGFKKSQKTDQPENKEKAYEYALFLLSLKLRTVGEVEGKMQGRGYTQTVIDATISQLKDQKYLDDQRYAEVFLENLKKYKYFGYYGIKKKFMEKKLPINIIDQVLADGFSVDDELVIAKKFFKKEGVNVKASFDEGETSEITYRTFDEESSKEKQKLAQKLKARGFRASVISQIL